ncbi:CHAP domain-containing protein [Blautia sp. AM47-4]|uniref:CHAP domain-containing protein n=1 Tax=Blautia sp. AM47-4 TaxID=2292979 RepID=UPI003FA46C58
MLWFQERGLWQDNSYEPRPGDIIFFDWDDGGQDGSSDHVGIVEKVENGRIYTIEVTPAIAAVKTVTRLVTMKSMGTEPRRIN